MKIAVVTGASSGMGKQFALQLSAYEQVDEIWAIARRKEALEALNGQCGAKVRPVCLDLGKLPGVRRPAGTGKAGGKASGERRRLRQIRQL